MPFDIFVGNEVAVHSPLVTGCVSTSLVLKLLIHGYVEQKITEAMSSLLLVRDAFVRTNRRVSDMMFVRLSDCLGGACIVIIRCNSARI